MQAMLTATSDEASVCKCACACLWVLVRVVCATHSHAHTHIGKSRQTHAQANPLPFSGPHSLKPDSNKPKPSSNPHYAGCGTVSVYRRIHVAGRTCGTVALGSVI